jgi:hypothetical protein
MEFLTQILLHTGDLPQKAKLFVFVVDTSMLELFAVRLRWCTKHSNSPSLLPKTAWSSAYSRVYRVFLLWSAAFACFVSHQCLTVALMYTVNYSDDKGHPCWTPQLTGCYSEFSVPSCTDVKLFLYNQHITIVIWCVVSSSASF